MHVIDFGNPSPSQATNTPCKFDIVHDRERVAIKQESDSLEHRQESLVSDDVSVLFSKSTFPYHMIKRWLITGRDSYDMLRKINPWVPLRIMEFGEENMVAFSLFFLPSKKRGHASKTGGSRHKDENMLRMRLSW